VYNWVGLLVLYRVNGLQASAMSLSFFEAFFFWFYCWERWLLWETRISSNTGGVTIVLETFVFMISTERSKC